MRTFDDSLGECAFLRPKEIDILRVCEILLQ
jgi:hypothetical protein